MNNLQTNMQTASAENTDLQTTPVPTEISVQEMSENTGAGGVQTLADRAAEPETNVQDQWSYDKITWPEDILPKPAELEAFKTLASELKLSKEQVQKLVDFEAEAARNYAAKTADEKRQTIAGWARQTKTFYGAKLEEEISFALRAADVFGGPDFRALLEDTGLGNHPVMIRTLVGIGRCISEDACPGGQPAAPQDKTFAEALYGKR